MLAPRTLVAKHLAAQDEVEGGDGSAATLGVAAKETVGGSAARAAAKKYAVSATAVVVQPAASACAPDRRTAPVLLWQLHGVAGVYSFTTIRAWGSGKPEGWGVWRADS